MKSIRDPSFEYTSSIESDIQQMFARVWRELGERERADADLDDDGVKALESFRDGQRTNDAGAMKAVVRGVSDQDIEALAQYIASLN